MLQESLQHVPMSISNGIGVGILSYNRVKCLRRLMDSIISHTNLTQTTVFISDDASDDPETVEYLKQLQGRNDLVVIRNHERLGVAGNGNRLIRCLSRFKYGILLNDDVEVLQAGWDQFYPDAIRRTGIHHFTHRQEGIYGAKKGKREQVNGHELLVVKEKPHGAIIAFSHDFLVKCGYLNESYGVYGMEHIDWSQRAWEMQLQPAGFWDVPGSEKYLRLHADKSVIGERSQLLRQARETYKTRTPGRVGPTARSVLPEVTYVVPFRNTNREQCIHTVINNIRAQKFPVIHIIMTEQDAGNNLDISHVQPVIHLLAADNRTTLFNKSRAFNVGVSQAATDRIILHDADMVVPDNYTQEIYQVLEEYEACHIGQNVLYADPKSTTRICETRTVDETVKLNRVVGYFEGGSLACTRQVYWRVGGFCEDFWGYGVEDCEFYARVSNTTRWLEDRKLNLLHLEHGRAQNWNDHHKENINRGKKLQKLSVHKRIQLHRQRLLELGWPKEILTIGGNPRTEDVGLSPSIMLDRDLSASIEANKTKAHGRGSN